ncbi:FAD-binding oxidoreductase [Pseudofrankia inefficax]|uniref:(R)-6-hydroxynicotine oxidase n=1 Tax=Pseudofrankia inefficax (strain DSM 45817 / CECT 9037 / DDB 130130 / EuI1c) TaxID=298654 RepID=E3JBC7_PSEI1|nr:FAD-binding oxidoreductase [Pseudofrankia inefficax]ADP78657.1 (R)-6-hydroxynicotine oxidase [Pseudofrankia inefficax]
MSSTVSDSDAELFAGLTLTGEPEVAALRAAVRGVVLEPGDPGWDAARGAFNLVIDQRPRLIAIPADAADVAAVLRFADLSGLRVAPQRTGHNAAPLGSLDRTILLRTDALREVRIDASRRRALVGAGAKWADVVPRASELGLAALHGSTPDVSVVGYTLGGGLGWYARALGLACNSVTGIQVVTPGAEPRWVDPDVEPELFWALRGGGGNFGVVTAIEFVLYPVAEVYAGVLFFPWERSSEVLHAWERWTRTVPDEMTSVGRILQFPPFEEIPEPLRGKSFVLVEGVFLGDEEAGARLIEPLRALGPVLDTFAMVAPAGIAELHMDPPTPSPYQGESQVLADLTPEAVDRFVAATGPGSGSPLVSAEIRHLGGELDRVRPGSGALSRMPGSYIFFGVGMTPVPESVPPVHRALAAAKESLAELASGQYLNFVETAVDAAELFPADAYARLRAVRAGVDPRGVVKANHEIRVAEAGN